MWSVNVFNIVESVLCEVQTPRVNRAEEEEEEEECVESRRRRRRRRRRKSWR